MDTEMQCIERENRQAESLAEAVREYVAFTSVPHPELEYEVREKIKRELRAKMERLAM